MLVAEGLIVDPLGMAFSDGMKVTTMNYAFWIS